MKVTALHFRLGESQGFKFCISCTSKNTFLIYNFCCFVYKVMLGFVLLEQHVQKSHTRKSGEQQRENKKSKFLLFFVVLHYSENLKIVESLLKYLCMSVVYFRFLNNILINQPDFKFDLKLTLTSLL